MKDEEFESWWQSSVYDAPEHTERMMKYAASAAWLASREAIVERLHQAEAQAQRDAQTLREALEYMMEEKIDYMKINHLGDPETQHSIKLARAAMKEVKP